MSTDDRLFWADRIAQFIKNRVQEETILQQIVEEHGWICYDEKTPSGRIHVGSGRGWVIHDTVARALRDIGLKGRFILSADDIDPMDDLPKEHSEKYKPYMGKPLRNVPSPVPGFESYADYYFHDVTSKFSEYGIEAELERTGDHYYNGDFNRTIKLALDNADKIQNIYRRFNKDAKGTEVLPFKPICEKCGNIGTTVAYAWDKEAELLSYRCISNLVKWAKGCGHEGQIKPYNGAGKLPWKAEWAAKWPTIGVIFETAGKDHFSAGGSRDIAIAIAREIFDYPPPLPSTYKQKADGSYIYTTGEAYEFFTVGGKKMSTGKGIGYPFSDMTNYAPGYILKFLLVRTRPRSAIDFDPAVDLERVYRDYDDIERKYYQAEEYPEAIKNDEIFNAHRLYQLCSIKKPLPSLPPQIEFNLGVMLVQITESTQQAIDRLINLGKIPQKLENKYLANIESRLNFLRKWVK